VILFSRTVLDTAFRAVYPFLPFIAAGMGVPVEVAAQIIQVRNLVGFLAPVFGPLSDRFGRRVVMLAGIGLVNVACLALVLVVPFWIVAVLMVVMSLGVTLFVPAQQAYFADEIPYKERGRAMALGELAWSGAAILGLPLMGWVLTRAGWQNAFGLVGLLGIAAFALIWLLLPRTEHRRLATSSQGGMQLLVREPMAWAAIAVTFLLAASNENINIVFGTWMNQSFGLDAAVLGVVAAAVGGAELTAELFAAGFVDRIGKWRTVLASMFLGLGAFLALPLLGANAWFATLGLVLVFFTFELTVVAALPLYSEIMPGARALLLSLEVASFFAGRALGSFAGPNLFARFGLTPVSLVSAAGTGAALLIWVLMIREQR
jgi:predicted MFS family arabinose efflux permease